MSAARTAPGGGRAFRAHSAFVACALAVALPAGIGLAFAEGEATVSEPSAAVVDAPTLVEWDEATTDLLDASTVADDPASVHGSYVTTTTKCDVCHSAHAALAAGDALFLEAVIESCEPCHLGVNATSAIKVSEGGGHGQPGQCTNGFCHATAPHGGAGVSKYLTLKTALLTDHVDSLLDAAIMSGITGAPAQGAIFAVGADPTAPDSVVATMAVYNPGVTAALLNDVSTPEALALGRAVGTGYVCANGACHIDGQFNSMTEDATWSDPLAPLTDSIDFKGHGLAAVADLEVRGVAYENLGTCSACHDSVDYRIGATAKQFPHGNDRIDTDGTRLDGASSAWFTIGSYLHSPDTTVTTSATDGLMTASVDGACIKCHRDSASGVGITF